jgi:hypothetical protein
MTLDELFRYLDQHTPYRYLCDSDAVELARQGRHPDPLIGEIISAISQKCQCANLACEVVREQVVRALSPLRLRFMADNAPVEGFRLIEKSIITIDAAFNDEALRKK